MWTQEQAFGDVCGHVTRMITRMKSMPEACHLRLIVQARSLERCLEQTFGAGLYSTGLPRETLVVECCYCEEHTGDVMKRVAEHLADPQTAVLLIDFAANNVTVFNQGRSPRVVEGRSEYCGEGAFQGMKWTASEFFTSPSEEESGREGNGVDRCRFPGKADYADGGDIPF